MFIMFLGIILVVAKYQRRVLATQRKFQKIEEERRIEVFTAAIQAEERQKDLIARNLHDTINPNLSVVQKLIRTYMNESNPEHDPKEILKNCESMVEESINGIREACFNLVPHVLKHLGLSKSIEHLAFNINKSKAAVCKFSSDLDPLFREEIISKVQLNIYRVTQELLNNILKHSAAKQIEIALTLNKENFHLRIIYDGRGINNEEIATLRKKGLGLSSIESRLLLINGSIDYQKNDKNNLTNLTVPLADQ